MSVEQEYINFALKLANEAGKISHNYYGKIYSIKSKADKSLVTQVDKEIEQTLRNAIAAKYPSHGIYGEEFVNQSNNNDYCWVIDPIDGTSAFVAGAATFTNLIALTHKGRPIIGIINQPIIKQTWLGVKGQRTICNSQVVSSSNVTELNKAIFSTTSPFYFDNPNKIKSISNKCSTTRYGLDAYAYANLASGRIDLVIEQGLKPYDYCALAPIIQGAGGIITDWQGKELTLQSSGDVIAASTTNIHEAAIKAL